MLSDKLRIFILRKSTAAKLVIASVFLLGSIITVVMAQTSIHSIVIETENGTLSSGASQITDASASAGKALQFNATTCSGPITITTGGTYTGCWQSNDHNTPAVRINTTAAVTILNSTITSKGTGVHTANGARFTIRGSSITIQNPGVAGVVKSRWVYSPSFVSATIENNDLNDGRGVFLHNWSGGASDTVKFRYNKIRNVDGRTSNGTGYNNTYDISSGFSQVLSLGQSVGIAGVEIAWNEVINTPGQSAVEDNFSFWMSEGASPTSRMHIHDNLVWGSWRPDAANDDTSTGTGFNSGDGDGTGTPVNTGKGNILNENNVALGIANLCFGLSGGHDITVQNNRCVVSGMGDYDPGPGTDIRQIAQPWHGAGFNNWNAYGTTGFTNNSVRNNVAAYWNRSDGNRRNDYWLPDCSGDCTGNISLKPGAEITYQDELNEYNMYLARVSAAGIHIGR